MSKEKNISVNIAGRQYPLTIVETEVQLLKEVEQKINQTLNDYQVKFSNNLTIQDFLAMALITSEINTLQAQKKLDSIEAETLNSIQQISSKINLSE